jgi:hypothetical protein
MTNGDDENDPAIIRSRKARQRSRTSTPYPHIWTPPAESREDEASRIDCTHISGLLVGEVTLRAMMKFARTSQPYLDSTRRVKRG